MDATGDPLIAAGVASQPGAAAIVAAEAVGGSFPRHRVVGLMIVGCLAALAGAVDAAGIARLQDLYVSFMSGNSTTLGVAIAQQDWPRVKLVGGIIGMFVAGAAVGQILALLTGRFQLPTVLCAAAAALTIPLFAPDLSVPAMTVSMGMLNAAVQQVGPTPVSITYVTGSLVKVGQGLGGMLCGRLSMRVSLVHVVPWIGLLSGVSAATISLQRYGDVTLKGLPLLAAFMGALTLVAILRPWRTSER